jgi:hypothetical protein
MFPSSKEILVNPIPLHHSGMQTAYQRTMTKTTTKGQRKIHKVMKEKKEGTLKSSSGKKVTSRKQAIAIALSEARRSGAKIPKKTS